VIRQEQTETKFAKAHAADQLMLSWLANSNANSLEGVKLVLERIQKASGFDEEICKLAEQGWETGFCAGQRVTNSHIEDVLGELTEWDRNAETKRSTA
jgi:hypothetical protein